MKKITSILLIFCTLQIHPGELSLRWFGTTNFVLSDGENTLLFDPFFTRPSISRVLFGGELKSDPKLVKDTLKKAEVEKIDLILISHTHYDHALDLEETQKIFN